MKRFLRVSLRKILELLCVKTLNKHKPTIICVVGNGETAVAREILYENIHQKYPARRNLEIPETEFYIPLAILGEMSYPTSIFGWLFLISKAIVQIFHVKPYKHFLILEIPNISKEISKHWLNLIKPQAILVVGSYPYPNLLKGRKVFKNASEILEKYKIFNIKKEFPQPRIRVEKGKNNVLIIDATHFYTPPPIKTVYEIAKNFPEKNIYLFSKIKGDIDFLTKGFPKLTLNPPMYKPKATDLIIIRGHKSKRLSLLDKIKLYE